MHLVFKRAFHGSIKRYQVFDESVKQLHHKHAINNPSAGNSQTQPEINHIFTNPDKYTYLRQAIATQLVDRLDDIKKTFPLVVDVGASSNSILQVLINEHQTNGSIPGDHVLVNHIHETCYRRH